MSFLVFSGHHTLISFHPLYHQWIQDNPHSITVNDIDNIPQPQQGLFVDSPSLVISLESIKAGQLRELLYRAEDTGENMIICVSTPPRGKFDRDGIVIHHCDYPQSISQRTKILSDIFDISRSHASTIAQKFDNVSHACIAARQCEIIPHGEHVSWSMIYIPTDKNSPPWNITDAICSGNINKAIVETQHLLYSTRTTPQALCMQLTGFFTKIIEKSSPFFAHPSRQPQDVTGMIHDMSYYPQMVMDSGKKHYALCSYVASLSSRFH